MSATRIGTFTMLDAIIVERDPNKPPNSSAIMNDASADCGTAPGFDSEGLPYAALKVMSRIDLQFAEASF